jgi:hypothetical protein
MIAPMQATRGVNGLLVLGAIVGVGLVTGAGFYRYKRAEMNAELAAELAAAPRTPEERLALWLRLSGPQIHHRLAVVGRFAPDKPWLVTHARARADGASELFGLDCAALPKELARVEGLRVVVELPAPRALGRATLSEAEARHVPLVAPDVAFDARARTAELALFLLEGIPRALARDIPGAELEIRVAPEAPAEAEKPSPAPPRAGG